MKTTFTFLLAIVVLGVVAPAMAQDQQEFYHIRTLFNNRGNKASGGYAAASNKFTTINGDYANLVELYGGWYLNHRVLVGISAAATTNHVPVPTIYSTKPGADMSYEYGQCGLMTEYVVANDRAIHFAFSMFAGAGFTLQYERFHWEDDVDWDEVYNYDHDENWFVVAEPGVQVEMNIFRWLRFSPGVSYRMTYGSNGRGLSDNNVSGTSVNMTLKIGKF